MENQTQMITMTSIRFTFKEGKQNVTPRVPYIARTWVEANNALRAWAKYAPKTGGYDKTDFIITWSDGDTYEGRFDLQYKDRFGESLLQDHINLELRFHAGTHKPEWCTIEQYNQIVNSDPQLARECAEYLQTHEFYDLIPEGK